MWKKYRKTATQEMRPYAPACSAICKHCGGEIAIRNPTGKCDHLYWPDMLTDEAKLANGFRLVTRQVWERVPNKEIGPKD